MEKELEKAPHVTLVTNKRDQYGRYLAGVFYETKEGEQYFSNRLLENQLATRIE